MRSATTTQNHRFLGQRVAVRLAILSIAGGSLLGCRASRPGSSMVQVTEESAAVAATLPAPEQRLATSRTGKPKPAEATDRMVSDAATTSTSPTPETTVTQAIGSSNSSTERQNASARRVVFADTESEDGKVISAGEESDQTIGGLVSASLTDLAEPTTSSQKPVAEQVAPVPSAAATPQPEPSAEAVAELPKQEPPRQRRPLNTTDQPNALDQVLASSLEKLPELPDAAPNRPGVPAPTRIGSEEGTGSSRVGDLPIAEEPGIAMNADQVKTVSHDSDVEPFATPRPAGRTNPATDDQLQPIGKWTTEELYAELLTRVTMPSDDEKATERERRQIIARYLMVLAGDPESAVSAMDGLNENEQQYLKNHLLGLWTLIDPSGHPSGGRRITEALPRYREATRHMAAATDSLSLNSLEFCTEIEAYGQVKPFEGNRFSAGQQVILYCEVENFSAADRDGVFQTQLQGSYDIYDASGTKVVSQLLPVDQQRSRNRLRDYFVAYQMNLPKQLSPGTYRLQLTVEDLVGKKYGQANIPFEIR